MRLRITPRFTNFEKRRAFESSFRGDLNKSFMVQGTIYTIQSGQRLDHTESSRHPGTMSFFLSWNDKRAFHCQNNGPDQGPRQPTKGYFDVLISLVLTKEIQCAGPYYHDLLSIIPTNSAPTDTLPKSRLKPPHTRPSTNRKLSTNHKSLLHLIHQFRTTPHNQDLSTMTKQNSPANPTTFTLSQPRESTRVRKATTRFLNGKNATYLPRLASALGVGLTHNKTAANATADDDFAPSFDSATIWDGKQAPNVALPIEEAYIYSVLKPRRSERKRQASKRFLEAGWGTCMPRLSAALGVVASDRHSRTGG